MNISALLMSKDDNVVTCIKDIKENDKVIYQEENGSYSTLIAEDNIPFCNKIAIEDIPAGSLVIKYGEIIGCATEDIKMGHLANHMNIKSMPRDYESEYINKEDN